MLSTLPQEPLIRHYRRMGEGRSSFWTGVGHTLPPSPSILHKPPSELWVQGQPSAFELLGRLPESGFAIVGTRHPQARSVSLLQTRMQALRGSPLIILSGLALGIDTVAHEEAMKARLPTIAILGSALDDVYPRDNLDLARRILAAGGLLVSEFPPGAKIERHFFLIRNQMIAGWSKATWVVEAGVRSGALNTAYWSRNQERDTYATPCFPGDPALAGTQNLITQELAYPFWEAHHLGSTWKNLVSLDKRSPSRRANERLELTGDLFQQQETSTPDSFVLAQKVANFTFERGGARVEELLEWALGSGWEP